MNDNKLTPLEKLLASAKSQISATWRPSASILPKLFAAKSIGEVEGYLKCLKDHNLISSHEYADAFDKMTKLWNRL